MTDEDREWRSTLKEGDKIDVLKFCVKDKIQMWSPAKIKTLTGDGSDLSKKRISVVYKFDLTHFDTVYPGDSAMIAPIDSKNDAEWREELK